MENSKHSSLSRHLYFFILSLIGGVSFGLHVYFSELALLCFISTSFWIYLIIKRDSRISMIYFFIMIYIMNIISVFWLKDFNLQSWLIAPIIYSIFYIPLYLIFRVIHYKWPRLPLMILWPIVFTGIEWFRVQVSPGKLPFSLLGDSLIEYPKIIQVVDIFGTGILTFLVCMISGYLTDLMLNYRSGNQEKNKIFFIQFLIIIMIYGSCYIYGIFRDSEENFSYGPKVGIIHPLFDKWTSNEPDMNRLTKLETLTKELLNQKVDIIVWPENSLTFAYNEKLVKEFSGPIINQIKDLSIELDTPILIDGPSWSGYGAEMKHTTALISPGKQTQKYDKVFLVPWSEYIPYHAAFEFISSKAGERYLKFISNFYEVPVSYASGELTDVRGMAVLAGNRIWYFGTPICFEIGVPNLLQQWTSPSHSDKSRKVDFILNPSNEVLLGSGIHRQTLNAARFRAIEGRITIIKASNDGISAMIDPNGQIKQSLERHLGVSGEFGEPSSLIADVIIDSRKPTIYSKIGDIFPMLCFALSLIVSLYISGISMIKNSKANN